MEEKNVAFLPNCAEKPRPPQKVRVYYLDWLRCWLVWTVVLWHSSCSGMEGGINGGHVGHRPPQVVVDDRIWKEESHSPLAVRWISLQRPTTMPLLFWISGASLALSIRGESSNGLGRSLVWNVKYTCLGLLFNSIGVLLGPFDEHCSPADHDRAACKGKLWDFIVWPWTSLAGSVGIQTWYPMALVVYLLINWPLLSICIIKTRSKSLIAAVLVVQWILYVGIYAWVVHVLYYADINKQPATTFVALVSYELAFIILAPLALTEVRDLLLPIGLCRKINSRLVHYALAVILLLQFSTTPFAERIVYFTLPSFLNALTGFNKYFMLGFIMLRSTNGSAEPEDAHPIASRAWPVTFAALVTTAPSSNWFQAGYLTFPFYPRMLDRMLLVAHGLLIIFSLDRLGRILEPQCVKVPEVLKRAGLLLFLCHPLFLAIVIHSGVVHSVYACLGATVISIVVAAVLTWAYKFCPTSK